MSEFSRRQFVALASSAAAGVWLTATRSDILAAGLHAAQATKFETLTPADAIEIEAATAQIVPTDETPGAREARVVYFIDKAISTWAKDQRPVVESAAKELRARAAKAQRGAKSFAALSSDKQIAVLSAMEKEKPQLFRMLRYGAIAGMLANPEQGGNYQKTGWRWIGFDDRFSWGPPFGWYDQNA
jgi:gluconate 2-dehydrogenase gamma chain